MEQKIKAANSFSEQEPLKLTPMNLGKTNETTQCAIVITLSLVWGLGQQFNFTPNQVYIKFI